MARDQTWLSKLKSQITHKLNHHKTPSSKKPTQVGVLAFEIAGLLSKLLALHHSLSDSSITRLKNDVVSGLDGVHKLVSSDSSFLLSLAAAEILQTLRLVADATARLSCRCSDETLISFRDSFDHFAAAGWDPHGWAPTNPKDLEASLRRADRLVAATSALYKEMEELSLLENSLVKKKLSPGRGDEKVLEAQQKVVWQKQEVKYVKEKSLWNKSFDSIVLILARLNFAVLARIKVVFEIGNTYNNYQSYPQQLPPAILPRSLSSSAASATVFPSDPNPLFVSGPLTRPDPLKPYGPGPVEAGKHGNGPTKWKRFTRTGPRRGETRDPLDPTKEDALTRPGPIKGKILARPGPLKGDGGFFEKNSKAVLTPGAGTLGAAALALHYANLIIVLEKMIKSPHLVGPDARDDVYSMLPFSIRAALRARLRGVGFAATDPSLAGEWRDALSRILGWLGPLAHNMIKWQSERSFEHHKYLTPKSSNNVFLLQTLHFANREKTEAAIVELLVGLNYIWRFEREMNAKALFECANNFLVSNVNNNNNTKCLQV